MTKKSKEPKDLQPDAEAVAAAAVEEVVAEENPVEKELANVKEQMLRLAAEYDNFRKRTGREREDVYAAAYVDAVLNFLPVADNLERATLNADSLEALSEGLSLITKQFLSACEKLGVSEIPTADGFDPLLHEAVMHVEDEALPQNSVAEVLLKGYTVRGKVIRPAMVKVAN